MGAGVQHRALGFGAGGRSVGDLRQGEGGLLEKTRVGGGARPSEVRQGSGVDCFVFWGRSTRQDEEGGGGAEARPEEASADLLAEFETLATSIFDDRSCTTICSSSPRRLDWRVFVAPPPL